jgi:hypothetical protein
MREASLTLALQPQHLCLEHDATVFEVIAQHFPPLGQFNLGVNLLQLLHQQVDLRGRQPFQSHRNGSPKGHGTDADATQEFRAENRPAGC